MYVFNEMELLEYGLNRAGKASDGSAALDSQQEAVLTAERSKATSHHLNSFDLPFVPLQLKTASIQGNGGIQTPIFLLSGTDKNVHCYWIDSVFQRGSSGTGSTGSTVSPFALSTVPQLQSQ